MPHPECEAGIPASEDSSFLTEAMDEVQGCGGYTAYCEDFEFAWQWEIRKHGEVLYSGASLSVEAARRAALITSKAFGIFIDRLEVINAEGKRIEVQDGLPPD